MTDLRKILYTVGLLFISLQGLSFEPATRVRGALLYMNYCSGCHSMHALSWAQMSVELHLNQNSTLDSVDNVYFRRPATCSRDPETLLNAKDNCANKDQTGSREQVAGRRVLIKITAHDFKKNWPYAGLSKQDTKNWFGKVPPDLSSSARLHTTRWLKDYLTGFYPDHAKLFGTNNKVFPDVNMPNVLSALQNQVDEKAFKGAVTDIVNFLEYAADPSVLIRFHLGFFVVGFLIIFCLLFGLRMRILYSNFHSSKPGKNENNFKRTNHKK